MKAKRSFSPLRWILASLLILILIWLPHELTSLRFRNQIYTPDSAPTRLLAIVFGAGLRRNGTPSSVLADRVSTAVQLYKDGKISKILMSGSTNSLQYQEPAAMKNLAVRLGVDPEDILLDFEGTRTLETCRRAKELYDAHHVALVSQTFHLPRALSICHAMGMDAIGVSADLRSYGSLSTHFWQLREIPATFVALWEAYLLPLVQKQL
jgi:vancomycin permeability regulator SanA